MQASEQQPMLSSEVSLSWHKNLHFKLEIYLQRVALRSAWHLPLCSHAGNTTAQNFLQILSCPLGHTVTNRLVARSSHLCLGLGSEGPNWCGFHRSPSQGHEKSQFISLQQTDTCDTMVFARSAQGACAAWRCMGSLLGCCTTVGRGNGGHQQHSSAGNSSQGMGLVQGVLKVTLMPPAPPLPWSRDS